MGKWKIKKLGDLTEIIGGGTPKTTIPEYWGDDWVWLSPTDLPEIGEIVDVNDSKKKITDLGLQKSSAKLLPKGTVLFSSRATIGKIGIASVDLCTNQGFKNFICKEELNNLFLAYALKHYTNDITDLSNSTTFKEISKTAIKQFKIPLPPIAEQQHIVAKLDALFADIDEAIGLLEENIAHTQALMGSVLDEIYSNGDTMLKDACNVGPKKSEVKDLDDDLEVSFLPMKDLNEHNINFIPNEIKKIKEVYKGYTYFTDGDVILAKVTPCFENGKAGLAKDLKNGIGFGSSEYHILRPKENVLPEWIYFAVLTEQFRVTGKENMTGAGGLKRIPRPFLEEWKIPVPDLSVQRKQIHRIVQIQEETKNLEVSTNKKLTHLKSLKSSLLDQAFKGEL